MDLAVDWRNEPPAEPVPNDSAAASQRKLHQLDSHVSLVDGQQVGGNAIHGSPGRQLIAERLQRLGGVHVRLERD